MDEVAATRAFEEALSTHSQEFGNFFLTRLFGLKISYSNGTCLVELDVEEFMLNPQGSLHGGVLVMAMDISMGHLLNHMERPGLTLEIKTQFVRGVRSGRVRVIGEIIKRGREICFLRAEARDSGGEVLAFATSTWKLIDKRA